MSRIISLDWETFYDTKAGYGIKELGTWHYCNHERFNPYLISVCDDTEAWAGEPKDFNWNSLDGAHLLSHNKGFDFQVYKAAVARGIIPEVKFSGWDCTANMTAFLCNRRSLADSVEYLLGVTLSKDVRDKANGKQPEDMKREGWWPDMLKYGRSDVFYCRELFMKHAHRWPLQERRLSNMTIEQGHRGLQIDREKLDRFIIISAEMLAKAESLMPWVADGRPPTSPKAIAEQCRLVGIPGPPVKSRDGEDAFLEWEEEHSPKHPWIANISNWRSINKFLESLATIKGRLMPGNIFAFSLKYWGAHTGRWSGDAGFNLQNMRKVPLYRHESGLLISDEKQLLEIMDEEAAAETEHRPVQYPSYVTAVLDIRNLFIVR
jgi:hypothetical protein